MGATCICVPCTNPSRTLPGLDHCAGCCFGSLVAEFVHGCPVGDHAEMAELQFPTATIVADA